MGGKRRVKQRNHTQRVTERMMTISYQIKIDKEKVIKASNENEGVENLNNQSEKIH